jgi:hypothetical protein
MLKSINPTRTRGWQALADHIKKVKESRINLNAKFDA